MNNNKKSKKMVVIGRYRAHLDDVMLKKGNREKIAKLNEALKHISLRSKTDTPKVDLEENQIKQFHRRYRDHNKPKNHIVKPVKKYKYIQKTNVIAPRKEADKLKRRETTSTSSSFKSSDSTEKSEKHHRRNQKRSKKHRHHHKHERSNKSLLRHIFRATNHM